MTIEEAINHCEEVAAGQTEQGKCPECAAEHRQLAAWLRELIALRAQIDFNGAQVEAERDALKETMNSIVHCKDCKHRYPKDFEAFCPHRVGPCKPDGFCERGEKK